LRGPTHAAPVISNREVKLRKTISHLLRATLLGRREAYAGFIEGFLFSGAV